MAISVLQGFTPNNRSNKHDLNLKTYNTIAIESLVVEHGMTNNMADSTRTRPVVTNSAVGIASVLPAFLFAQDLRVTAMDNFQIDWVENG
ncbi:hypothetical protein C8R34_11138 [Nitrosomonas sp. Nm84]|uniref:hypothetical protein n=1 Tax=Nitrosomonas sp. Nm84 TaxID=200124 RepID=UPI000D76047B|nr:hypothetical protein [Nitrosomonas sp. Nm84]PXW87256.1 hypothetical protein C8R34_11138 [Nitrosomonas sp. Nm84]